MTRGVLDEIRVACAEVAKRARFVHIDEAALRGFAEPLVDDPPRPASVDPAHQRLPSPDATLAYVLCIDAVNFGSGWFPVLRKRPGCSGYLTIATCLRERFESEGTWSPDALRRVDTDRCVEVFEQQEDPQVRPLMQLFAQAFRDLGDLVVDRYAGRYETLVEAAAGSAERLIEVLTAMPLYRDVARYDDFDVPLYKRAQITAADLASVFEGKGAGRFGDLDRLTIFADNLVPHVLRRAGVLVHAEELAARIDAGELLAAGSAEEVEIRAVAVHAVEQLVGILRTAGVAATARTLDTWLWNRGQRPDIKAYPRHRTRTPYY